MLPFNALSHLSSSNRAAKQDPVQLFENEPDPLLKHGIVFGFEERMFGTDHSSRAVVPFLFADCLRITSNPELEPRGVKRAR